jgi:hypothetical protein
LTITAVSATKVYGAPVPTLTATYSGFINGDTPATLPTPVALATTANAASPVGTYPITASGATSPNYAITFGPGTLTVTPAPLVIRANDATKVYGAAVPSPSAGYTGFVNGDTAASLIQPVTFRTAATTASHVGTYTVAASGAASSNYAITFVPGTLTVTPAPLIIAADNQTMTAGGVVPPLTATYLGFVNGDSVSSLSRPVRLATAARPLSPPGRYVIHAGGASSPDYTIAYRDGILTILPAPVVPPPLPVLSSVGLARRRGRLRELVLTFNGALDATRAAETSAYHVYPRLRPRRHPQRLGRALSISSAAYDPRAHTVTLSLRAALSPNAAYVLRIDGSGPGGLTDPSGRPLGDLTITVAHGRIQPSSS